MIFDDEKQKKSSDKTWATMIDIGLVFMALALVGLILYIFLASSNSPLHQGPHFAPGDPTATPPGSEITDPNFLAGQAAYEAQRYEEVIDRMGRVIEVNSNLAPAYWYRGMATGISEITKRCLRICNMLCVWIQSML